MLQASDLTKAYDGAPLFDGLSFVLGDGERAGLVGPNGVGKSTLLRLLAGRRPPRPWRGAAGAGERIGWLAQEAPDAATTLGELLGAGLGEVWTVRGELRALEARLTAGDALARHAGALRAARSRASRRWAAGPWRPRWTRPGARWPSTTSTPRRRWPGSRAASRRGRCWPARCWPGPPSLLLDEPTNHLDGDGLRWLGGRGCAASPGRCSSSPTTARSSTPSSAASSSSSRGGCADPLRGRLQRSSAEREAPQGEARARLRGPGEATTTPGGGHRDDAPPGAAHRAHREPRGGPEAQALRQEGGEQGEGARGPAAARARGRPRRDAARRARGAAAAPGGPTGAGAGAWPRCAACARARWPTSTSRCIAVTASRSRGPTAPARRRCSTCWPACSCPPRARRARRAGARCCPRRRSPCRPHERVVDWLRAQAVAGRGRGAHPAGGLRAGHGGRAPAAGEPEPGRARAGAHGGDGRFGRGVAAPRRADQPPRPRDAGGGRGRPARVRRDDRRGLPRPRLPRGPRGDATPGGPRRQACSRSPENDEGPALRRALW